MTAGRRARRRLRTLAADLVVAALTAVTVLRARVVLARGGLPAALAAFGLGTVAPGRGAVAGGAVAGGAVAGGAVAGGAVAGGAGTRGAWDARSRRRARVAGRVLRLPGLRSSCLPTAITLGHVLRHGGVPVDVVIGVSAAKGFSAHAWVELAEGRIDLAGHPLTAHREISRLRPPEESP